MLMPYGKHKGEEIEDLPDGYLAFVAAKFDDGAIQAECEKEFKFRVDNDLIGENE